MAGEATLRTLGAALREARDRGDVDAVRRLRTEIEALARREAGLAGTTAALLATL